MSLESSVVWLTERSGYGKTPVMRQDAPAKPICDATLKSLSKDYRLRLMHCGRS